jgi:hypothetical protein
MGRAAHGATARAVQYWPGSVPASDPLLAEISAFLARPESDDDAAVLERALTDGYARVLLLETDRLRLEKQIMGMAAESGEPGGGRGLQALARERELRARDLVRLRAALGELRGRYSLAVRTEC